MSSHAVCSPFALLHQQIDIRQRSYENYAYFAISLPFLLNILPPVLTTRESGERLGRGVISATYFRILKWRVVTDFRKMFIFC